MIIPILQTGKINLYRMEDDTNKAVLIDHLSKTEAHKLIFELQESIRYMEYLEDNDDK